MVIVKEILVMHFDARRLIEIKFTLVLQYVLSFLNISLDFKRGVLMISK